MNTTSDTVSVIIDDLDPSFLFDSLAWNATQSFTSYKEVSHVSTSDTPTFNQQHRVELLFEGNSIAIFGDTPSSPINKSGTFSVIIDGSEPNLNDYDDPNPPSYRQWYQSPMLSAGAHNITFLNITGGASIDYAIATIGSNSLRDNQTILIDSDNSAIKYLGAGWTRSNMTFDGGSIIPHGNHTHRTNNIGDSFEYMVPENKSVVVYGVIDYSSPGVLALSVLDGNNESLTVEYNIVENNLQEQELGPGASQLTNVPILPVYDPQGYVLRVEVTNATNQSFTFNYITIGPGQNIEPVPENTLMIPIHGKSTHRASKIAGGVVGGVAFVLLVFLVFHFVQRSKRQTRFRFAYPFIHDEQRTSNSFALQPIRVSNEGSRCTQ